MRRSTRPRTKAASKVQAPVAKPRPSPAKAKPPAPPPPALDTPDPIDPALDIPDDPLDTDSADDSSLAGTSLVPLNDLTRALLQAALVPPADDPSRSPDLDLARLAASRAFDPSERAEILSALHFRVTEAAARFDPTHARCSPQHCTGDAYRCFLLYARRILGQTVNREVRALARARLLHVSLDDTAPNAHHSRRPARDLHQRSDGRFELTRRHRTE